MGVYLFGILWVYALFMQENDVCLKRGICAKCQGNGCLGKNPKKYTFSDWAAGGGSSCMAGSNDAIRNDSRICAKYISFS